MKTILYLHGFGSSGKSNTSDLLIRLLPEYNIICPDIPSSPEQAYVYLNQIVDSINPDIIIGSSLGGLYASIFKDRRRIVINPAYKESKIIKPGTYTYFTTRENGDITFDITDYDVNYINWLIAKVTYKNYTKSEKDLITVILGTEDDIVTNITKCCKKMYGSNRIHEYKFGHRLTEDILINYVINEIKKGNI